MNKYVLLSVLFLGSITLVQADEDTPEANDTTKVQLNEHQKELTGKIRLQVGSQLLKTSEENIRNFCLLKEACGCNFSNSEGHFDSNEYPHCAKALEILKRYQEHKEELIKLALEIEALLEEIENERDERFRSEQQKLFYQSRML